MKALSITFLTLLLAPPLHAQKTILVGPGQRNGDFNDDGDPSDQRNFEQTPFWENISGASTIICSRTNLTNVSGSRNAQISHAASQLMAQSTEHTLSEGDSFSLSYQWRDAFNWNDQTDQVNIILFVTADDLIESEAVLLPIQQSTTPTRQSAQTIFSWRI
jgi:hypothetical protein